MHHAWTLALFLFATLPGDVSAAELKVLGQRPSSEDPAERHVYSEYLLSGPIEPGDADRITSQLPKTWGLGIKNNPRVHLDSPGGNLADALKIAEYFWRNGIATYVGEGAQCLSACSLIFMSGGRYFGDSTYGSDRTLHVGGKLGFHAPFLAQGAFAGLPREALADVPVATYRSALDTASNLLRLSSLVLFPPSLLQQMLTVPADRFLYVDTIDKAGRWAIELDGIARTGHLVEDDYAGICLNRLNWHNKEYIYLDSFDQDRADKPSRHGSMTETQWRVSLRVMTEVVRREPDADGNPQIIFFSEGDPGAFECTVTTRSAAFGPAVSIKVSPPDLTFGPDAWTSLRPSMSLAEAAVKLPPLKPGQAVSTPGSRQVFPSPSMWDHNGSKMLLTVETHGDSEKWVITYQKPRDSMRREGVTQGTVLFQGERRDNVLRGRAFVFRAACNPYPYVVDGLAPDADDVAFELTGVAPKRTRSGCDVEGFSLESKSSSLKFKKE